jgi:hypothetical protein
MSNNNKNQPSSKIPYKGLGLAIGMIFGGIIGLLIGNPIIFAGGGMVLGLAVGLSLESRN